MVRQILWIIFLWICYLDPVLYYGEKNYFTPIPEIITCIGLSVILYSFGNKYKILKWIARSFAFLYHIIYFTQCFYYYKAGEFLSVLALQNWDQLYLIIDPIVILGMICTIVLSLIYIRLILPKSVILSKLHKSYFFAALCILTVFSFTVALHQNSLAFNKVRVLKRIPSNETPLLSLCHNGYVAFYVPANNNKNITSYPFEKDWIYHKDAALPFAKSIVYSNDESPNIILIFTEGTSSRLLGCYGGKTDLTPNIDDFASHSMVVDNYYNHTAATFRGTHGQLASCYPQSGGWEKGGWEGIKKNPSQASLLSKRNYQTLPKLLNKTYDTCFISPHAEADPYTDLLKMLGFKSIYTRDQAESLLHNTPSYFHESIKDEDMYTELTNMLKERHDKNPFFIAMYTFDTHTGVDIPSTAKPYDSSSNMTLNTLHYCDSSFGKFWEYFKSSKFAQNTIVIFTADHTHYHDKSWLDLVGKDPDYVKAFIDRIPLIIYDPYLNLPHRYDADDRTSLDLTPTICQLIGISSDKNSFLGESIFDKTNNHDWSLAAIGTEFYAIYNHKVWPENQVPASIQKDFANEKQTALKFYDCESTNHVFSQR